MYLEYTYRKEKIENGAVEYLRYLDLTRQTRTISQSAVVHDAHLAIGVGDEATEMRVGSRQRFVLRFLRRASGARSLFGSSEDSLPTGASVVVLGNALWKTRFGGRRDILGQQLQVGAINATIIGVAPAGFCRRR